MSALQLLQQPYPLFSFPEAMRRDLFFGFFLCLFLLVFTPFGLEVFAYDRFHIILGYGLVSYATIAMNDIAGYHLAPRFFSEPDWKVSRQVFWTTWHMLALGVTNLTYGHQIGAFPLSLVSFFKIEFYVVASAILPIMAITLLRQNRLLKRNQRMAQSINRDIQENGSYLSTQSVNRRVKFLAENNKDYLEVDASSIVYITSQDNYAEFVILEGGKVRKELLRSSLTRIEELLPDQTDFFRCHRAFLINLNKIKSVEGNSQGYRLSMVGMDDLIPVARPKNKALRDGIHSRRVPEPVT